MTYQEYVTRVRLEHACKLLASTRRPVTDIAFDSGFQSVSQFHRSFRAIYGEKPLEYRRKRTSA
jgi:AraC family cel operon transcriptional repressor